MYTDWYEVKGGMQDFNYDFSNAMEITIEVSCCKYPNRERILIEWENNIKSIISFIEEAQNGIRGYVKDENGNPLKNANIRVKKINTQVWNEKEMKTDQYGRYWRILRPGEYTVQAKYNSNISSEENVTVPETGYIVVNFIVQSSK